jgi:hypothetical protein
MLPERIAHDGCDVSRARRRIGVEQRARDGAEVIEHQYAMPLPENMQSQSAATKI